jgi:hypothetical protein
MIFFKAYDQNKMIGNLSWIFGVVSVGRLFEPRENYLHYPWPSEPAEGFEGKVSAVGLFVSPSHK